MSSPGACLVVAVILPSPGFFQGDIDVNTVPDLNKTTAIAATGQTRTTTMPRLKLSPEGVSIDHPDPELGAKLMCDALGIPDRDAMHGILRQLVKASAKDGKPDPASIAFMLAMVEGIKPRDSIEAMLVAQMVAVHAMAMRCAYHLACAEDVARYDSAARALGRLARTFPAQIEALNRHRSHGEPAITVQNVSVGDGGKAIVGNVTQHVSTPDRGARQRGPENTRRKAQVWPNYRLSRPCRPRSHTSMN